MLHLVTITHVMFTVVDIGLTQYESSVSSVQKTAEGGIEDVFISMNTHFICILDQKHIIEINSSSVHFIDKANVFTVCEV